MIPPQPELPRGFGAPKIEEPKEEVFETAEGVPYPMFPTLEELEREHILKALERHKNNKTHAAAALGVTLKTLYNKLHDYGLNGTFIRKRDV